MMLTVEIKINGRTIKKWKAGRVKGESGEYCKYKVNNNKDQIIIHHYDAGAVVLAQAIIGGFAPLEDGLL